MSKKDYIAIARAIREEYDIVCNANPTTQTQKTFAFGAENAIENLTFKLASVLELDNPDFDRKKFILAAIGPNKP